MSVAVLVSGTLFRVAEQRTSSSGRKYVKATLRAAAADNSTSEFWDLLIFSESAQAELERLGVNERVSVQGALKLELYEPEGKPAKIQRTIFVDYVLALRAPPKEKKKPNSAAAPASQRLPLQPVNIVPAASPEFDDDIPF
jgi:hypothetical protein